MRWLTEEEKELLYVISDGLEYPDRIDRIIKTMEPNRRVWASKLLLKLSSGGMIPND